MIIDEHQPWKIIIPKHIPQSVPETGSENVPESVPKIVPDSVPESVRQESVPKYNSSKPSSTTKNSEYAQIILEPELDQ